MTPTDRIAFALGSAFLATDAWTAQSLAASIAEGFDIDAEWWPLAEQVAWVADITTRTIERFPERPANALHALTQWLAEDDKLWENADLFDVERIALTASSFVRPRGRYADLDLPKLDDAKALAEWLQVDMETLDWLARTRRFDSLAQHHYRLRLVPKKSGGFRPIEVPKPQLKAVQRRILDALLVKLPTHAACFGFVRGRSPLMAARKHTGRALVVRLDLVDFFLSIHATRVTGTLRAAGFPEEVAYRLSRMMTTSAVPSVVQPFRPSNESEITPLAQLKQRLRTPHLPQGAPTSPMLANLVCHHLDARLDGLATQFGVTYTRYADDLTFSGDAEFARSVERFVHLAVSIAADESFHVSPKKTRVMRAHDRQEVLGIIVNEKANIARETWDDLRAALHHVGLHGFEKAHWRGAPMNEAQLNGRIAQVLPTLSATRRLKLERLRAQRIS